MPQNRSVTDRTTTGRRSVGPRATRAAAMLIAASGVAAGLGGCETDSFFDPSVVGRWQHTPTTVPILTRLSAIETESDEYVEYTEVQPDDLIPLPNEYRVGPGDRLQVAMYDDVNAGQPGVYERAVDIRGVIDLPQLGQLNINGRTVEQAREIIKTALSRFVTDPLVSVQILDARQQVYQVMGAVESPGPYFIAKPDYRLLEALATAGRFPESTDEIFVIRQVPLTDEVRGILPNMTPAPGGAAAPGTPPPAPMTPAEDVINVINDLTKPAGETPPASPDAEKKPDEMRPVDPAQPDPKKDEPPVDLIDSPKRLSPGVLSGRPVESRRGARAQPPAGQPGEQPPVDLIDPATTPPPPSQPPVDMSQPGAGGSGWIFVNGQWVQLPQAARTPLPGPAAADPELQASMLMSQRVIRIPLKPLIAGDSKYNIVIRPGDIVRVPAATAGIVYVVGQVQRPGTYNLPEVGKMTLLRAVDSAGGLGSLAIPERVDLTRVVGKNRQATIRLDMRAINQGTMPDIYIKPDDRINVGTNFWAYPLAVFRNGLRVSYGFGFVLDRNFANEVFGVQKTNTLGQ